MDRHPAPQRELLTREQCTALKGLAIVMVMVHNFCHLLTPAGENEFEFTYYYGELLSHQWHHLSWEFPLYLFSMMGGVHLFVFLSGYGITRKHEATGAPLPGVGAFMWQRVAKSLVLLAVPYAVFLVLYRIYHPSLMPDALHIAGQLTMTINLMPEPEENINPGPYWFLGMIMQMYLLYRVLLHRPAGRNTGWRAVAPVLLMMAACVGVTAWLAPRQWPLEYLRYNCVFGGLAFGCGVMAARHDWSWFRPRWWTLLALFAAGLALALEGNYHLVLWLFTSLFMVVAFVALIRLCRGRLLQALRWVGGLSAMLYVVHPVVRQFTVGLAPQWGNYAALAYYLALAFAYAMLYRPVHRWLSRRVLPLLHV